MANWQISIKKQLDGYPWVNSYRLTSADLESAQLCKDALVTFERAIHSNLVEFVSARTAPDPDPGRAGYITIPLTGFGDVAYGAIGELNGPEVVLFANLIPATGGTPGKKSYRYALGKDNVRPSGSGMAFLGTGAQIVFNTASSDLGEALDGIGVLTIGDSHRPGVGYVAIRPSYLDAHHGWFNKGAE